MIKNRAKRKAARAAAYEVICEGLCIAALFPMTVGFIWLSESLERALLHFAAAGILALSAAAFHLAADALYTEEVISNVVSAEVIRAVGASLRPPGLLRFSDLPDPRRAEYLAHLLDSHQIQIGKYAELLPLVLRLPVRCHDLPVGHCP